METTQSHFWNCCPLKLQFLPDSECQEGRPILNKNNKLKNVPRCQWWINSKKHNYCFWKYIKDKSNEFGEMEEIGQSDLAKLFSWSNTKAHFILKEALKELIEVLKIEGLQGELSDDESIDDLLRMHFNDIINDFKG